MENYLKSKNRTGVSSEQISTKMSDVYSVREHKCMDSAKRQNKWVSMYLLMLYCAKNSPNVVNGAFVLRESFVIRLNEAQPRCLHGSIRNVFAASRKTPVSVKVITLKLDFSHGDPKETLELYVKVLWMKVGAFR